MTQTGYFTNFDNIATLIVKSSRFPKFREIKWHAEQILLPMLRSDVSRMAEEIDQSICQKVANLSAESSGAVALSRGDLPEVTWLRYVLSDNRKFVDSTGQVVDSSKLFAILALRLLDDAAMFILHMSDPRKSDEDGDCLDIASALVIGEQDLRCALLVSDSITEAMQAISYAEGFLTQKEHEVILNKQHLRGLQEAASVEAQRRRNVSMNLKHLSKSVRV